MAGSIKEHINLGKAEVEEKLEKAAARTEEDKKLAHERKKAKEARAKMELHQDKARHAEEGLRTKQPQYIHGYGYDQEPQVRTASPMYNLKGHPPPHGHEKH